MTYFLVYVSTADRLMSRDELRELMVQARRRNSADGLTGALLYHGGTFMQVLEGEREQVLATYDRIGSDPRHHDVTFMIDGDIPKPQFAEWTMAFRDLTADQDDIAAGFNTFMNSFHTQYGPEPSMAQRLLVSFRRSLQPLHL